eukprot:TRINITY_DN135500_c0_g1_i1.p2 TRINITY_DN135500_c0_g1~~TRINITY_DN135500_c0_g1_i1.p2  ORF type:complete len:107 (+),score=4.17 TRINITY_DN135500_c0_g1_i1:105-425(+)
MYTPRFSSPLRGLAPFVPLSLGVDLVFFRLLFGVDFFCMTTELQTIVLSNGPLYKQRIQVDMRSNGAKFYVKFFHSVQWTNSQTRQILFAQDMVPAAEDGGDGYEP